MNNKPQPAPLTLKQLHGELAGIVKRFRACFTAKVKWPDQPDLSRFRELIDEVYRKMSRKKVAPAYFWNRVKAVDAHWPGIQVCTSITRMVDRAAQVVPSGPRKLLVGHYKSKGVPLKPVPPLLDFLLKDDIPPRSAADWSTFDTELDLLISKDMQAVVRILSVQDVPKLISWLKFIDVQHQSLAWRVKYEPPFDMFIRWVYELRNSDLDKKMEPVSWSLSPLLTPDEWRGEHKRRGNASRQQKFRSKKSP